MAQCNPSWSHPASAKLITFALGIMVLDGYQTASADFIAGEQYEISCENEPGIKVVRGGA